MNVALDIDTDTAANALELAYAPRRWAVQVHDTLAGFRFVVCIAHRRAGKTWVACASLIFAALANPKTNFAYIAPTRVQAK